MADQYVPDSGRYDGRMPYRRCGRSGLKLPVVSLGFWHNFGDDKPLETQRAIMRRAFDLGITHFDLANNYGPPFGSAEINAGRILAEDFADLRDELVISSKAGWDMWPGPYGDLGSRKYILAKRGAIRSGALRKPAGSLSALDIGHLSKKVDEILCKAILGAARLPLAEAVPFEAKCFGEVCGTEDMRIGVDNFLKNGPKAKAAFVHR
jgi:hypothetical protein